MGSHPYLALLRAINVGGKNPLKMSDLKACLEEQGYTGVRTYLNTGNVIFRSGRSAAALERDLSQLLTKRFDYQASVVVLSASDLKAVVQNAPPGFGAKPQEFYSDVLFLIPPLKSEEVRPQLKLREGVDHVWEGDGVLYFARLGSRRTQSKLSELTKLPVYQRMTIRTMNTVRKLVAMLDEGNA
jgi:uncharacterized protein (DUF1697 family)